MWGSCDLVRSLAYQAADIVPTTGPLVPVRVPSVIAIGGLSGTGKSTLARALVSWLAAGPGAEPLRSDVIRKDLHGVAATVRLPPEAYDPAVTRRVLEALFARARGALAAGKTVILDAVFAREEERHAAEVVAAGHGPFVGLWLEADLRTRAVRVANRTGDASDATIAVVHRQATFDLGVIRWHRLDANRASDAVTAEALRLALGTQAMAKKP